MASSSGSGRSDPSSPRCPKRLLSRVTAPRSRSRTNPRSTIHRVLRRLRIENLVLIREAALDLAPGLNAITGETGAGKTILAQSIGLLLGARGDAAMIGPAGEEAYVETELDGETDKLDELRPEGEAGARAR